MEAVSMTSLLRPRASAQLIIAIARMFGKAVKLRHCPATVSAPVSTAVILRSAEAKQDFSLGVSLSAKPASSH